ncbi:MAG: UvrD-helicase domain-containing protein [Lentisphaeraceae bacterium]|nr:UvrD-helicase domain-containing protein [Lentisphaeraceae bacterium]
MNLNSLNEQQRDAVETIHGPVLILAGAGTGKTMVITYRIAHLMNMGIPATSILAVTFTNKAAHEMQERVSTLVSKRQAKELTVSTFHSFGLRMLAKYGALLGYSEGFSLIDYGDQIGIIKEAMSRLSYLDEGGLDAAGCLALLSRAKNRYETPDDLKKSESVDDQKIGNIYEVYQDYLQAINVMDFDDLIMLTVQLFEQFPNVLQTVRERYKFLMVDEFQDTNYIQMKMIRQLCGKSPNICSVGDDDQSIYSWRGAEIANILNFDKEYDGCKVIKLEQNYRCTNNILHCANKVISINSARHVKNLWSDNGEGELVRILRNETAEKEAQSIAEVIYDRVVSGENKFGDFAVLYRSNKQSRIVEEKLRALKVKYHVIGDKSFYERREIRDALAYLNAVYNRHHNLSLLRIMDVPPRGIGPKTIKAIRSMADSENISVSDVLDDEGMIDSLGAAQAKALKAFNEKITKYRKVFEEPGNLYDKVKAFLTAMDYLEGLGRMYKPRSDAEARYQNVEELLTAIDTIEKRNEGRYSLGDYLQTVSLAEEYSKKKNEKEEDRDSVTLLTVHASKGLEFPYVFIIGLEQNLFPHERSLKERALAEERRLFYVALTRAKKDLVLSWCHSRKIRQEQLIRKKSQFLFELPEEFSKDVDKTELIHRVAREDIGDMLRNLRDKM